MKGYTVYVHICSEGKRYYGATKLNVKKRWRNGEGYRNHPRFWEAIKKYGWNNFQHVIVAKGLTEDEAYWLEKELIKAWDTTNPTKGYNMGKGGKGSNGVKFFTEEHKKKLSDAKKGKYDGKNHPMYGKHHSEDTRKKISENHIGFSGKQHSEDSRNKISKANGKSVICLTTKRVFLSAKDGSDYYGISRTGITLCCQGKRKSAGKLVWRYLVWNHNKIFRIYKEK